MRNNTLLFRTIFGGSPFGLDILTKIQTKIDKQLFFHRRGKIADNYIKEQKLRRFFSLCAWNWSEMVYICNRIDVNVPLKSNYYATISNDYTS